MNVLVVGKPKSGTTVISKVIQKSLPPQTRYALEPSTLEFFAQPAPPGGIVVKTLFDMWRGRRNELSSVVANAAPMTFDKRCFTLRDPRDEAISYLLYYAMGLKRRGDDPRKLGEWVEFLREKEAAPLAVSFLDMVRRLDGLFGLGFLKTLSSWGGLDEGYSRFLFNLRTDHYVMRYEEFIAGETRGLGRYLGVPVSEDRDVGSRLANTKRSARAGNWKRYVTPEDIAFFRRHEGALARLGYEDWELTPVDSIPESEMSGYVAMLIAN